MPIPKFNKKEQDIFFISDFHLFHDNVINHDNRPFSDIYQMHEYIINQWNSKVGEKDVVFFGGDMSLKKFDESVAEIVRQLNGKIHFILGNHDSEKALRKYEYLFEEIQLRKDIYVIDETIKGKKQYIVISHYPIVSWNKKHHGSWHLHGHSHGNLINSEIGKILYQDKILDIGCNLLDYEPIEYEEVKDLMDAKTITSFDHH